MTINPNCKLELSPDARALLQLPLRSDAFRLWDANESFVGTIDHYGDDGLDSELAAFIAAALNALLTPTPARLCDFDDCDQAALPGGDFCATHQAEHAENMAACEQVEAETPAEHRQQVTAAMEVVNQPVLMCAVPDCLNAADPTTPSGTLCLAHDVARFAARWTTATQQESK